MKFQEHWLLPQLTIVVSILFAFSLVLPIHSFAKSGCCSGHSGVNCAAGAQSNGNVICNDGWRGSSCSYSGMVMCGGSSVQTVVYTTAPIVYTPRPTLKVVATIEPTIIPTNTPQPTENSTPAPQVQGVATSPSPSPAPLTTGDTVGVLAFLAVLIGLPVLVIRKIVRHFKNRKTELNN